MGALAGGKSQADTRELGHATVQYPGQRETRDGSGHSAQHRGRTRSCDPSGPRGSRRQDGTLRSDSQSDSSPKRQEKINGAKISDEKRPPLHVTRSPEPTVGVWTAAPRTRTTDRREGGERRPRPSARPARGALAQRASGEAGPAAPTDACARARSSSGSTLSSIHSAVVYRAPALSPVLCKGPGVQL